MTLNEIHDHERGYLPATGNFNLIEFYACLDSRYRPDQRHLENAEPKLTEQAKKRLEQVNLTLNSLNFFRLNANTPIFRISRYGSERSLTNSPVTLFGNRPSNIGFQRRLNSATNILNR
jgi:hypothetical protein